MKTYTLSPQGISRSRQRFIQRMVIMFVITFGIIIALDYWRSGTVSFTILIISFLFLGGIMAFIVFRNLKRFVEIWESAKVEVGEDYIARSQLRIPEVRVDRADITYVEETGSGLYIHTADKRRTLIIPIELDNADYQEIKELLSTWTAVKPRSVMATTQNIMLLVVLIIGFGILFVSTSLWVVLLTGIAMTGFYGYIYWRWRNAEGVDPRYRRNFLIMAAFPLFLTIIRALLIWSDSH